MKANLAFTLTGCPRSKKNSMQIVKYGNRRRIIQSKKYLEYEHACAVQIKAAYRIKIDYPVCVKAVFFRSDKRRCDLPNLENALLDTLVKYDVLSDDNRNIVASMDGSGIYYDKENPRTEVTIYPLYNYEQWDTMTKGKRRKDDE